MSDPCLEINFSTRVVTFSNIAQTLEIPESDVATRMIHAIATHQIQGRIDEENSQLIIDGSIPPKPSESLIQEAKEGLQQLDEMLTDSLDSAKRPNKRNRSAVQ